MIQNRLFHNFNSIVPAELCELIIREGELLKKKKGTVYATDKFQVDPDLRNTDVGFWDQWHWVNGIMTHYIAMANREFWNFDVIVSEGVQFGVYGEQNFYDWHCDEYTEPMDGNRYNLPELNLNRKLSATLNLSDPLDYVGGDLLFKDGAGQEIEIPQGREQGSIVVFPSNVFHRVTPVTEGVRRSCVSWILGPQPN